MLSHAHFRTQNIGVGATSEVSATRFHGIPFSFSVGERVDPTSEIWYQTDQMSDDRVNEYIRSV